MSVRRIVLHAMAKGDLRDIWRLIDERDGEERAERVYAGIEAFCRSLEDVPPIGTRHDERREGLRSTGIPGLKRASVLFRVMDQTVIVLRIGYLGRNVWGELPE